MTEAALAVHRAFYDAVETGDVDLMASLWADDPETSCIHPGATPLRGTAAVLRSWTVLMANVGYIQFFLTEIELTTLPARLRRPDDRGDHLHREHPVGQRAFRRGDLHGRQGDLHQYLDT